MSYKKEEVLNKIFEIFKKQIPDEKTEKINNPEDVDLTIINSVEFVKFIVQIEMEYNFEFSDEYLRMEHFSSFSEIVEYVFKQIQEV